VIANSEMITESWATSSGLVYVESIGPTDPSARATTSLACALMASLPPETEASQARPAKRRPRACACVCAYPRIGVR
jgi:hypothetical protein